MCQYSGGPADLCCPVVILAHRASSERPPGRSIDQLAFSLPKFTAARFRFVVPLPPLGPRLVRRPFASHRPRRSSKCIREEASGR